MDVIYFPFGDAFTCIELYKRNVQGLKLVYRGKYASIKKNTIWAGLKCFYDQIWEFAFDHIFRKCRVYVYNQGLFPAFVIENRHALGLEFSLKRNLFAGSCHEDSRSAAFIALTSILLAGRTFSSKRLEFIFELIHGAGVRYINIKLQNNKNYKTTESQYSNYVACSGKLRHGLKG